MHRPADKTSQVTEEFLRSIFDNAQIGIGIFNIQTGQHYSNRALIELLGYTQQELSHLEQWDKIVHPDDRATGAKRYAELIQGKRDQDEYVHRFIRRDGHVIVANGRFTLLRDSEGMPQFVLAWHDDTTESRARDRELQSILDNSLAVVQVKDLGGRYVRINRRFEEIFGLDRSQILGKTDHDLFPKEIADRFRANDVQVAETGRPLEFEETAPHKDGPHDYISIKFPLFDDRGVVYATAGIFTDITDRKHGEKKLRESEQLFRSIFENSQTGISFFNIDGHAVFTNRAFQEMLGYTGSELSHLEKWDEIIHPDERASGAIGYAELVQGKREKGEWEQRFVRRDGRIVVTNARFSLIRDLDGKPQYVASLTEDITESKRAQQELRASEQLFRSIFENAQIGIGIFKIEKQELSPNRALQEMLGYSEKELSRLETWDEITHPDESLQDAKRYAELVEGKHEKDEWEQRLIRRDGRIVVTNVRFSLLRDPSGRPQYVASLQEDITERRAAENLLRKRDEELRRANFLAETALELTKAGYWHVPLDGSGWYNSSPRRAAVLGDIPQPEHRYRLDDMFAHAEEADEGLGKAARKAFNAAIEGNATYDTVFAYRRPTDGGVSWVHALGHLVKNAEGKPTDMYGVSQDITDFKRLEMELSTAKEVAEAATKAKSDFLANMSHEIRTPMNAILGMTHLSLKTEMTPKQRDYLMKSKTAAQTLLGIINDILDFSKIEAGKLEMEETPFRLDDVLENLSSVVSQKAQDKSLEFLIAAPHDLPLNLIGDPLRLGQILINLVNNAVKFTDHGEVVVAVAFAEKRTGRVKLKFSVRDSGIGLTPEQMARLFQAFSQADTSTTRKYGGTGLGLSISKRLVEMMGGEIWVESKHGEGSTFHFTAWFGVGSAETGRKHFIPDLAGIRVLVVDDNAQAREILADALRTFALKIDSVSSASDALQKLVAADSQNPYQLILMDWHMPGMDGLEASRIIKRGDRLTHVPKIVMVTAFGREDIRTEAEKLGIDGYLLKPVSASLLYDTLVDLFAPRDAERGRVRPTKDEPHSHDANGIRILLVEDNEMNQQVATELFESAGASVRIAHHGAEAVKILAERDEASPFDVVFMDLQMPEMDGYTATRLLRAQPRFQSLPIIAMTAHALVEERQRCLEAGMNDHVTKPIDPDALFSTLLRWTKPRPAPNSESTAKPLRAAGDIILPQIEGIDISAGLKRVAGNKRLYLDLLTQFATQQHKADTQIAAALGSGDRQLADRIAHTVKGVAGNIGLAQVSSAAEKLEKAIRQADSAAPALLQEFGQTLRLQMQAIENALRNLTPVPAQPVKRAAFDPQSASVEVARLRVLLEASDAEAGEAFLALEKILAGAVEKSPLDALGTAINEFNFEAALVKLNAITKELGEKLEPPK